MKGKFLFFLAQALVLFALISLPLRAGWIEGGIALDTRQWDQTLSAVISDGEGGAVVVWTSYVNEGGYLKNDIYAQRIDRKGNILWAPGGQPICVLSEDQFGAKMVSDGQGGYIIAWSDGRSGSGYADIYAQRIDGNGTPLWTTNGIPVCTASGHEYELQMIPIQGGGAVMVWLDSRSGTNSDIYAQRLSNSGSKLWVSGGVAVCTNSAHQEHIRITPGDNKSTNVVWQDSRNGNYDIYANRIDSLGNTNWGTSGNCICCNSSEQYYPEAVSDGSGGALVVWIDSRNGNGDIYGSRVQYGSSSWERALCTASGNQIYPIIQKFGQYGAIVAWKDSRGSDADLYAQRIDLLGNTYWTANGLSICTYIRDQHPSSIIEDGAGNAIFSWSDSREIMYNDIYAQKVDGQGNLLWNPLGVPIVMQDKNQLAPSMAPDGAGGAIVAFEDERLYPYYKDIYAQRLDAIGCWGYPAPEIASIGDVPNDQGGRVIIEWEASPLDRFPYTTITHYSVWRSLSDLETASALSRGEKGIDLTELAPDFEGKAYRFIERSGSMHGWEWLGNMEAHRLEFYSFAASTLCDSTEYGSGMHYFFVASHSSDPFAYWDSEPDSGYSVDNLPPSTPRNLAGKQNYSPQGLLLTWAKNFEADLAGYRVYRGTREDFVPDPSNLISSKCDTVFFDSDWHWSSGYYYKLAAFDVHGNESHYAMLGPDDVTETETPVAPSVSYLSQNYPNPFNPTTKIGFGLSEPGHVALRIFDVAGKLVLELVNRETPAGRYEEVWNGRDDAGREVSSGIYFYRLDAGSFSETRKMILLR